MQLAAGHELQYDDIQGYAGLLVLEFGATWCGYCQAAQPIIQDCLNEFPQVTHIKIEDGKGKRLGRLFTVKLWPTLIFLNNGNEIKKLVRPENSALIKEALLLLTAQK